MNTTVTSILCNGGFQILPHYDNAGDFVFLVETFDALTEDLSSHAHFTDCRAGTFDYAFGQLFLEEQLGGVADVVGNTPVSGHTDLVFFCFRVIRRDFAVFV